MNKLNAENGLRFDPVMTEIIRNGLVAATEEMKTILMRTAYNVIIYEALDFTTGIFDAAGNTLSIGLGLPMFIRGMSSTVKAMIQHFGLDGMVDGDILVTNDAYITGSHLNHITIVIPTFSDGRIIGFSACMAHWQDIGGVPHSMSLDIYSEGLQLPFLKLYRAGVRNEELVDIIRINVRNPELAMGDLRAQVGASKAGEKRLQEMIEKYGLNTFLGAVEAIFDQSEASARGQLRAIPDGVYEAESFLDDDGVSRGERVPIKVKVIVSGDQMTVDLTDVSPQVKGYYNSGPSTGLAAAQVAFKCLVAGTELPINDGCFRPLSVRLPEGTVVSARRPAPMRWWMTYPMTVVDTVFKAIAPACPEKVIAGHYADLCMAYMYGRNPHTDAPELFYVGLHGGGWGAKHNEDGMSATIPINDGDTHNGPVEQLEAKYPVQVERYALRIDSGGAGRQRGGLGTDLTVRLKREVNFTTAIERVECRPWGLFGGLSALGNEVAVTRGENAETRYPTGKLAAIEIVAGDQLSVRTGGGGGFGSPLERPVAEVLRDAREGYISVRAAYEKYGVAVDPLTWSADLAVTERHRAHLRDSGLPLDQPYASGDLSEAQRETQRLLMQDAVGMEKSLQSAGVLWTWTRCC